MITRFVSRVACMRLLDGVIFSARPAAHAVLDDTRPPPCLPPPAAHEVRPSTTAGTASTSRLRHPPRPRIQQQKSSDRPSNLTPRITRRPKPITRHDIVRVGGRVHALVRPAHSAGTRHSAHRAGAFSRSNAAHHAPAHMIAFDDMTRVAGRVHALVRPPNGSGLKLPAPSGRSIQAI
jgi:hypothetical protein